MLWLGSLVIKLLSAHVWVRRWLHLLSTIHRLLWRVLLLLSLVATIASLMLLRSLLMEWDGVLLLLLLLLILLLRLLLLVRAVDSSSFGLPVFT